MSLNSKMTALANEIRELSGTITPKGIDVMTSDINAANAEITEQAELLEQIATALEGKASGGSTEDLNTELTTQENLISQLSTILDSKASGGSGGSNIETCTVIITFTGSAFFGYSATVYTDNLVQPYYSITSGQSVTIENVICGSSICVLAANAVFYEASGMTFISTSGGLEYIGCDSHARAMGILKAPLVANSTGVFSLTYD